jgi:hypothetical protein
MLLINWLLNPHYLHRGHYKSSVFEVLVLVERESFPVIFVHDCFEGGCASALLGVVHLDLPENFREQIYILGAGFQWGWYSPLFCRGIRSILSGWMA